MDEEVGEKVRAGCLPTANALALLRDQWRARLALYARAEAIGPNRYVATSRRG